MPVVGIDTNVFLRVFIDDEGSQHRAAVDLVQKHGQVFIGTVVMVETVWALRSLFKFPKERLVQFVNAVLAADSFILENRQVVEKALFSFASGKAGFADYVILEAANSKGIGLVYTFDRNLAMADGAALVKGRSR